MVCRWRLRQKIKQLLSSAQLLHLILESQVAAKNRVEPRRRLHCTRGRLLPSARPRYYTGVMSTELTWETISTGSDDTMRLARAMGGALSPPVCIVLSSDLGGGKTTFVRGLAAGVGSSDTVSSPTFTLKKIYKAGDKQIYHYDFYRLNDPGIMRDELAESIDDPGALTVIEWSSIVKDVLPKDYIAIELTPTATDPDERVIRIQYPEKYESIIKKLQTEFQEVEP